METSLKLLSQAIDQEAFNAKPLITSLHANLQYTQEEYATLLVKGRFDQSTATIFKSLQKGNSGFDNKSIQNVRIATELSSIYRPTARHYSPFRPRGAYGNRYNSGHNSNYNSGSSYGRGFRRDDVYSNIQGPRFRNPGPCFSYDN